MTPQIGVHMSSTHSISGVETVCGCIRLARSAVSTIALMVVARVAYVALVWFGRVITCDDQNIDPYYAGSVCLVLLLTVGPIVVGLAVCIVIAIMAHVADMLRMASRRHSFS